MLFLISEVSFSQWVMTNDFNGSFRRIFFSSDNIGYITDSGSPFEKIYKTTDSGASWAPINITKLHYPEEIYFINDTLGFVGSFDSSVTRSIINKTNDGGITWTPYSFNTTTYYPLNQIFFTSYNIGFVSMPPHIYKTIDNGTSWDSLNLPEKSVALHFINDTIGFYVPYFSNDIYKTTDGGITWTYIPIIGAFVLNSVNFINDSIGFVYGNDEIWETTDQGYSWNKITSGVFNNLLSKVVFINKNLAYAITNNYYSPYVIYKTTDGGANWIQQVYAANDVVLTDISFLNDTVGYAVGGPKYDGSYDAIIIKTTNGGGMVNIPENNTEKINYVKCYPNPASDEITISITSDNNNYKFELINLLGEVVLSSNENKNLFSMSLKGIREGYYICKITDNKGTIIYLNKIVITI
jgi:photosystem II stability/assembly factor-like uncharacterized protein